MDEIAREFFELKFKVCFMERRGDAFQSFFSDIMEKCHPGDFQRVRPWGRLGDQKNDGYLKSKRMLFQSYAPDDMAANAAIAKINEDFLGALPYWERYFDSWVFVHNDMRGLGPTVLRALLDLQEAHKHIAVTHWGYEELRQEAFTLNNVDLSSLLGPVPTRRDLVELRIDDLVDVILGIDAQPLSDVVDLRPIPAGKVEYNSLSDNVRVLLNAGMGKADLVEGFFNAWSLDPTLGDRIAATLTQYYEAYRTARIDPDLIFHRLFEMVRASAPKTPSGEVASLAVLAYFFEQCDIFERPSDKVA